MIASRFRVSVVLFLVTAMLLASGFIMSGSQAQESRETTVFEVGNFDEVHLRGAGTVTIVLGDDSRIEITSPPSISRLFSMRVEDGELTGGFAASVAFDLLTSGGIDYVITTPALTSLDLNGPMQATVDGIIAEQFELDLTAAAQATLTNLQVSTLDVELDLASSATVSGIATTQEIELNHMSNYDAAELDSKQATVDFSSAATGTVRVSDSLTGSVTSGATLHYLTENATVDVYVSSGGAFEELAFTPLAAPATPVVAATPAAAGPQELQVSIAQFKFDPATLEIHVGDTVTWTNNDRFPHDVTQLPAGSGFSSPQFGKGESFSVTFDAAGTYDYYCALHPIMLGTIVVTE